MKPYDIASAHERLCVIGRIDAFGRIAALVVRNAFGAVYADESNLLLVSVDFHLQGVTVNNANHLRLLQGIKLGVIVGSGAVSATKKKSRNKCECARSHHRQETSWSLTGRGLVGCGFAKRGPIGCRFAKHRAFGPARRFPHPTRAHKLDLSSVFHIPNIIGQPI